MEDLKLSKLQNGYRLYDFLKKASPTARKHQMSQTMMDMTFKLLQKQEDALESEEDAAEVEEEKNIVSKFPASFKWIWKWVLTVLLKQERNSLSMFFFLRNISSFMHPSIYIFKCFFPCPAPCTVTPMCCYFGRSEKAEECLTARVTGNVCSST